MSNRDLKLNMFHTEPLLFPPPSPSQPSQSPLKSTPSFTSWALYLIPHIQTISQSCSLCFPNISRVGPLSSLPLPPKRPHYLLLPKGCSLPTDLLSGPSTSCIVCPQLSSQSDSFNDFYSTEYMTYRAVVLPLTSATLSPSFTVLKLHSSACWSSNTPSIFPP